MIEELIGLLSCNDLNPAEVAAIAELVKKAPEDPELHWIEDPAQAMTHAILNNMTDYIAESDKIDELHEQLEEMFTDPLPAFPYDDEAVQESSFAYFKWLDEILAQRGSDIGGYELLSIDDGVDDYIRVAVVNRKDTARILELALLLEFRISRENGTSSWQ
ncbi:hypothetical protein HSX11_24335 [Oxalobacteraceae bacterium]|nr:hypothetical protein [Oxalobacteraceae bacterium]